ncbi:MAG: ABC transporter [Gammaproteobacteria bacterium CG22_combo_CG10-13_8_21_14_all_40_8]|nr:MAG: ABC transporter [Gammaproteobacteria bacterium CG22_combo_CG10-13_8_21_14_all_40_8]
MPIIEVKHASKWIESGTEKIEILNDVNFCVDQGETVAILGASGSGKSTLLGILAGLDTPSAGEIEMDGQQVTLLDEDARAALRAQSVGFVFQNFFLVPGLSALENVMLPLQVLSQENIQDRALEYLTKVGLAHRIHHLPSQLSGVEQQRVALARAFVTQPKILFADEPTGNLDQHTGSQIIDLIFELNELMGTTLILVTHDLDLAQLCDRRLFLNNGTIAPALLKKELHSNA